MTDFVFWRSKDLRKRHCGQRYGNLTVIDETKKRTPQNRLAIYFICRCDCGRTVEFASSELRNKRYRNCGDEDCKYYQSESPSCDSSVIVKKLKAKYLCRYPEETCVRSLVCKICCCECDKPCKKCKNTPDKCGALKRRQRNE